MFTNQQHSQTQSFSAESKLFPKFILETSLPGSPENFRITLPAKPGLYEIINLNLSKSCPGKLDQLSYVHYYKGKFNAYQRTYVLTGFSQNIHFIKRYLDRFLPARIDSEVNSGNTPYIKMGTLTGMNIILPDIEDQARIATILSDMDAEIQALETKMEKYRKIKLGMMQNLLTGKIRLL